MDVVFDIDGTLANAEHRIHHIVEPANWIGPFKKDWDTFLSDELVALDTPIPQTWDLLNRLIIDPKNNIRFITGRKESSRDMTVQWLLRHINWRHATYVSVSGYLYMRSENDRRPSYEAKRDALNRARAHGLDPTLVFEDRADDAAMWREEGLLCCQVAKGDY